MLLQLVLVLSVTHAVQIIHVQHVTVDSTWILVVAPIVLVRMIFACLNQIMNKIESIHGIVAHLVEKVYEKLVIEALTVQ